MRSPLFLKIFAAFFVIAAVITLSLDVAAREIWQRTIRTETASSLEARARLVAELAQNVPQQNLSEFAHHEAEVAGARVTIVRGDGAVIADSSADPAPMGNHGQRPEVRAAFANRDGLAERRSMTLGVPYLYVSVPFRGGALRLAYPLEELESATTLALRSVLAVSLAAFFLSVAFAAFFSRNMQRRVAEVESFASRLAEGDFSARLDASSHDELARISTSLNATAERLELSFSELSASRNRLETLLNGMHEAVVATDASGRTRWMNQRFQTLFPSLAIGQPLTSVTRDPDVVSALQDALASGAVAEARSAMLLPGRSFQISAAPLRDQGLVVVMQETTRVDQAERTRRDFIANVSHELKTPLTSIRGYVETLLGMEVDPRQSEFLAIVERNAERMSRLIEDLLTLARVESGEDKLQLQTVRASVLLEACGRAAVEVLRISGQRLRVESKSALEVRADQDKIEQVVLNFVENAAKYGASAEGVVMGNFDQGGEVIFYVRDFGAGIRSEHLPRVFERFYRGDPARTASGGTGLGLAICKHIVLKHHGRTWVESELGKGATFYFALPAAGA